MDADDPFPHVSVAHRMLLGWVPAGWIQHLQLRRPAARRWTRTSPSTPIEPGAPPAGRSAAVEVRIGRRLELLLRVPQGQGPQIGDRGCPPTIVSSAPTSSRRRSSRRSPARGSCCSPARRRRRRGARHGDFYKEIDGTAHHPVEFRVDVIGHRRRRGRHPRPLRRQRPPRSRRSGPGRRRPAGMAVAGHRGAQRQERAPTRPGRTCRGSATPTPSWPRSRTAADSSPRASG